jgi:hypothetical protein
MRISRTAAMLLALTGLSGCGEPAAPADEAAANAASAVGQDADPDRVACARGAGALARDCTVDRVQGADGLSLVVHFPDGGFRRLKVVTDGRGVVAADGAEPARVAMDGAGAILVSVGADRIRLPAHARPPR